MHAGQDVKFYHRRWRRLAIAYIYGDQHEQYIFIIKHILRVEISIRACGQRACHQIQRACELMRELISGSCLIIHTKDLTLIWKESITESSESY